LLFTDPLIFFAIFLALVVAISIHEFSHVFAAWSMGDDTGASLGRLTINPLAHLDLWGTLAMLLIGFGWGKPAPYNPNNLRDRKWGETKVALAGPISNLILLVFFVIVYKFLINYTSLGAENLLIQFLFYLIIININLIIFNLIPLPPLDGSKVLLDLLRSPRFDKFRFLLETRGPAILFFLIILDSLSSYSILGHIFNFVYFSVLKLL
jgi:Zn-dependent protease